MGLAFDNFSPSDPAPPPVPLDPLGSLLLGALLFGVAAAAMRLPRADAAS